MSGLIGSGDLYAAYYGLDGTQGPYELFGNATKFAVSAPIETKSRISRGLSSYGRALDRTAIPGEVTFSFATDEGNPKTLALGLSAQINSETAQSSGTQAPTTAAVLSSNWTALAHHRVSAVVVIKTDPGPDPIDPDDDVVTTYQLGRDYEVISELGWIRRTTNSTIGVSDNVQISYAYAATSMVRIIPASQPIIRARFVFDGRNLTTGRRMKVTIANGQVSSSAEIDLLSQDYLSLEFMGAALPSPIANEPDYFIDMESA